MPSPFGVSPFGGGGSASGTSGSAVGITGWGADVTLLVEIDLSQAVEGSAGASPYAALWDGAVWDTDVWVGGTTWTDVTQWARGIEITAKASRQSGQWTTSTLTLSLSNIDGRFSPDNMSSPYRLGDSTAIGIWRPIRVRAEWDSIEWPLFTGYIRSWDESFPELAADAVVEVTAQDGFSRLAAFNGYARTPVGGSETTGDRVLRILTAAGWNEGRYVDDGTVTCLATDLEGNAVNLLNVTAASEGGAVWCGPDGAVYFDSRNALIEKERSAVVQAVFADDGRAGAVSFDRFAASYDGDLVVNMTAYTRTGGTTQTATVEESRSLYGDRQAERSDLICEDDSQVLVLAQRDVALGQAAERRIESISFLPQAQIDTRGWEHLARQEIQQRALAQVVLTPPQGDRVDRLVHVIGMSHSIGHPEVGNSWRVSLEFSSATLWQGLVDSIWDVGFWDSAYWAF